MVRSARITVPPAAMVGRRQTARREEYASGEATACRKKPRRRLARNLHTIRHLDAVGPWMTSRREAAVAPSYHLNWLDARGLLPVVGPWPFGLVIVTQRFRPHPRPSEPDGRSADGETALRADVGPRPGGRRRQLGCVRGGPTRGIGGRTGFPASVRPLSSRPLAGSRRRARLPIDRLDNVSPWTDRTC